MHLSAFFAIATTAAVWSAALALSAAPSRAPAQAIPVTASSHYDYAAPPSISRETYTDIWCEVDSAACREAGQMYDVLVASGIDPVIEAAQASHETTLGTLGVGVPAYKNAHGVQCFATDGRIGETSVPWGNGCAGVYSSYTDAVRVWAGVITKEYVNEGLTTPALAVPKYAPTSDGNSPTDYIADMERKIDAWRARERYLAPASFDLHRQQVVEIALSRLGKPYKLGSAGPEQFDCSGLVTWSYGQLGIDTTRTTFDQLKNLPAVESDQLQTADMVYFQYPSDQHVGLLADLDGDGRWDMVQSGGQRYDVNIVYDVFANPVYANAIIGYRRAL